ncbi:FtsX-like permease family protein [Roseivirga sp. E12]|uniref:FtsX-like permease family protein n=1 Tax=Roseivirga sp. E12 TaxID=2819237 RepID=UPI001ABCFA4A|nr:FtsX-like permease family protein [Roseivirga sp. E12]MBO3698717.1 ABC transporter permease [Roseivirga sp. E12]
MNVSSFIARRYFTSKKTKNFIQVLSWVSMIGVAIGTMALIVVLSVFNGLEDVLRSVYQTFDPDLKIESVKGKSFEVSEDFIEEITQISGVTNTAQVIEDNALVSYRDQQVVVRIKGIEESYLQANKLDTFLLQGELKLRENDVNFAILGAGVAYELGILLDNDLFEIEIVYPRNLRPEASFTTNSVRRTKVKPSAVFSVEQAYDESLVMTSIEAAKRVLGYKDERTSVEVYIGDGENLGRIKKELKALLGEDYRVLDSDEQHSELLKAVKIEKLFVYIALTFITLIASFNIFFSLSMLAIEKRRDMSVLFAFGATKNLVKGIFIKQGIIIAILGSVVGLLLGLFLCWLQQTYELIGLGMSNAVNQAYPVKIIWTDFIMVGLSITIITILTAYRPAVLASKVNPIAYLD